MLNSIPNADVLDQILSEPTEGVVDTVGRLDGDIITLGVGGKMGPTLALMAKRASDMAGNNRKIIGVSRFSDEKLLAQLNSAGIETIKCDLLNRGELESLPDAPNVIYMAGMKFGSTGNESLTWAMNAYLPGMICQKYRNSKIVAFSSGNIYGLTPIVHGGSAESDAPNPTGEYAISVLGRERILEHFSKTLDIPMATIRLNYATELRYGVLVDLAVKIANGEPVDLTMGNVNVLWQGDANAMILRTFDHVSAPPFIINIAGTEMLSIRRVAEQMASLMHKEVKFTGTESPDGILSNGQLGHKLFGYPGTSISEVIECTADWVMRGGDILGKPTHFETRDGKF
jgi:hypothetical protein